MLIPALLLTSLGVMVIFTSSQSLAIQQALFALVGVGFYFGLSNFDYRSLRNILKPIYFVIVFLLFVTLFLGFETRGSIRWIPLGLFNLQPSEFAKPVLILLMADFWTRNRPTWKNIFKSFIILFPIAFFVFRQPDLGTTLTILFIWLCMLFASQIDLMKVFLIGLAGVLTGPLVWFLLQDYQKKRIFSFLNPTLDPQGIGFHVIQSTIAVGSGQFWGRGLGRGTQSRLQFLPEFRTDFIFAFIAEELGFIGSMIVLTLFSLIFWFLFRMLFKSGDRFGELIIIGVMAMLFFQIFINVGMNTGLLPITGITLPLLSYGGSSMITTLISLGLVASIGKYGLKRREIDKFVMG